jgi:hypothetical protein
MKVNHNGLNVNRSIDTDGVCRILETTLNEQKMTCGDNLELGSPDRILQSLLQASESNSLKVFTADSLAVKRCGDRSEVKIQGHNRSLGCSSAENVLLCSFV